MHAPGIVDAEIDVHRRRPEALTSAATYGDVVVDSIVDLARRAPGRVPRILVGNDPQQVKRAVKEAVRGCRPVKVGDASRRPSRPVFATPPPAWWVDPGQARRIPPRE